MSSHVVRAPGDVRGSGPPDHPELEVVGEIAHAFLEATRPVEIFRTALARVTPRVGADFSSVFLLDETDPGLIRLVCAYNWPQIAALHLGEFRIRAGSGPTGRAVTEARAVEVENVFDDASLHDWWDAARELGIVALLSLPLSMDGAVAGAITFYHRKPHRFDDAERRLLRLIADQLAITACHALLIQRLDRTSRHLRAQIEELSARVRRAEDATRTRDD